MSKTTNAMIDKMNGHKLCYGCIHFCFDLGCPDWSDQTPGDDVTMFCAKNVWNLLDGEGDATSRLRSGLENAITCEQWSAV